MHFLMPQVFASHAQFKDWFSNPLTGMVEGSAEVGFGTWVLGRTSAFFCTAMFLIKYVDEFRRFARPRAVQGLVLQPPHRDGGGVGGGGLCGAGSCLGSLQNPYRC